MYSWCWEKQKACRAISCCPPRPPAPVSFQVFSIERINQYIQVWLKIFCYRTNGIETLRCIYSTVSLLTSTCMMLAFRWMKKSGREGGKRGNALITGDFQLSSHWPVYEHSGEHSRYDKWLCLRTIHRRDEQMGRKTWLDTGQYPGPG